jgi:hypothetical protein
MCAPVPPWRGCTHPDSRFSIDSVRLVAPQGTIASVRRMDSPELSSRASNRSKRPSNSHQGRGRSHHLCRLVRAVTTARRAARRHQGAATRKRGLRISIHLVAFAMMTRPAHRESARALMIRCLVEADPSALHAQFAMAATTAEEGGHLGRIWKCSSTGGRGAIRAYRARGQSSTGETASARHSWMHA